MLYTVTLNPSLDHFARTGNLRVGALNRTYDETLYPGGKGVNTALMLRELGAPVHALGFVAGQTGALFSDLLRRTGLPCTLLPLEQGQTRINFKLLSAEGQTELNGAGPSIPAAALQRLAEALNTLREGDWLVLSGSLPAGVPEDAYARLVQLAHTQGAQAAVDASGRALKNALAAAPDLIKPNLEELGSLLGRALQTPEQALFGARELQRAGAKDVLVSLGAGGAVFAPAQGEALYLPAPAGRVVQTIGSGDAMTAGWLCALLRGLPPAEALRLAVAAGSAAAFCAWLPCRAETERTLARTGAPRPCGV